jgi:predicted transglutaminase-like cysteine proteinase
MTGQDLSGVEDCWATPAEMLSINGADCEDFAIDKYFTLIASPKATSSILKGTWLPFMS